MERQTLTPSEPPEGNTPPGGNTANINHAGATTIFESTTLDFSDTDTVTYSSDTGGENALLVTGGTVSINSPAINKTGDESSENADFYGTNAAVLATGGELTLENASIETSGTHANAVFAYGDGKIVVKNTTIKTTSDNSGGIMVAGGGSMEASGLTVTTSGRSSAPIRSDRGGGTMKVSGGSYTSTGIGSPSIYSTAKIVVSDAKLESKSSEGIVIEGKNSVQIENVTLEDTNNTLNGNSETYKNIFIYQSMSGDASEGTGSFAATNSNITTNQGDTFFITNTTAEITLTGNRIINNDETSAFLRAQAGKWGNAGSNGGNVTLTLKNQVAEGDIILDNISTLNLVLNDSSFYMGAINSNNAAKSVSISIDETSQLVLAGDTFVDTLENADSTNQNIYSSGFKLYVAGTEVAVNNGEVPETPEVEIKEETEEPETQEEIQPAKDEETNYVPYIVAGVSILVIIIAILAIIIHGKKKHGSVPPTDMVPPASMGDGGRPDFSQFDDGSSSTSAPIASAPTEPVSPQFSGPAVPPQPTPPSRPRPPLVGRM